MKPEGVKKRIRMGCDEKQDSCLSSISITISSSLRFIDNFMRLHDELIAREILVNLPNIEYVVNKVTIDDNLMKKLVIDFFRKIDGSEILYVYNLEGYIGTSVLIEMGYAHARGKLIISKEPVKDASINAIVSKSMDESTFLDYMSNENEKMK